LQVHCLQGMAMAAMERDHRAGHVSEAALVIQTRVPAPLVATDRGVMLRGTATPSVTGILIGLCYHDPVTKQTDHEKPHETPA
jgi:hypothetical protein